MRGRHLIGVCIDPAYGLDYKLVNFITYTSNLAMVREREKCCWVTKAVWDNVKVDQYATVLGCSDMLKALLELGLEPQAILLRLEVARACE